MRPLICTRPPAAVERRPDPRSRAVRRQKEPGRDLKENWPTDRHLGRIFTSQGHARRRPQGHGKMVVTWMATKWLTDNHFGSRSSREAESRKAMETSVPQSLLILSLS